MVELVIVILLMWVKNNQKRLALVAWISSMFLLYRVAIHFVKTPGYVPCPCSGNAAAWMHVHRLVRGETSLSVLARARPPLGCMFIPVISIGRLRCCSPIC